MRRPSLFAAPERETKLTKLGDAVQTEISINAQVGKHLGFLWPCLR